MEGDLSNDLQENLDKAHLSNFDPFFHFVMLEFISSGEMSKISIKFEDDIPDESNPLILRLRESEARKQDHLRVLTRVYRYFASETLMLLLFSGQQFGPFVRISSVLRNDELNSIFADIANKKIPERFALKISGVTLDFQEWLSFLLTGSPGLFKSEEHLEIVQLIVEEGELLKSRGLVNAFKHAKPLYAGESQAIKIFPENELTEIYSKQIVGANWMEWQEKKGELGGTLRLLSEEIDIEVDRKRIFAVCLLLDTIKEVRLARINGRQQVDINFPTNIQTGITVKRQKLEIRYGSEADK